ncbi:unnamed protein product [Darwinula stevensoni]|uniref:Serpin domain-containing protein n=1 Tax=Darwinula stevensoni TaxID=69355 RepID=A0A7R8X190_9CRUS|nr:unnamed protein product [Darwinula stevensoni]CAG0882023.1 unnamed protein product [Darwinula stevensoni]
MKMANMLYVKKYYEISNSYKKLLRESYESDIREISMNDSGRRVINSYVKKVTDNRINDLIPSGVLNELTNLVLVNAIYFKGKWKECFFPEATRQSNFQVSEKETVPVSMMFISGDFPFGRDSDLNCKYVKLSYVADELEMLLVLPDEVDGWKTLGEKITGDTIATWSREVKETRSNIYMPCFKAERDIPLKKILQEMGLKKIFLESADFSGIAGEKYMFLSDAFHMASIEVDEYGTEAAAATSE